MLNLPAYAAMDVYTYPAIDVRTFVRAYKAALTQVRLTGYPLLPHRSEFEYSCGRTSQIWEVKEGAKKAIASNRTSLLARHKTVPVGYLEHR